MPFIPEEETYVEGGPTAPDIDRSTPRLGKWSDFTSPEIWRAALDDYLPWAVHQATGGYADDVTRNRYIYGDDEPGYDPFDDLQTRGLELYANDWANSRSRAETATIIQRVRSLEHNRELLAEGGMAAFTAQLGLGLVSPENFVPAGGIFKAVRGSGRILEGIAEGAAINLGAVAVEETALTDLQGQTRTFEETVMNTATAAVLGGVIGGGFSLMGKSGFKGKTDLTDTINEDFGRGADGELPGRPTAPPEAANDAGVPAPRPQAAGAAPVPRPEMPDMQPRFSMGAGELAAHNPVMRNPTASGMRSPSTSMRRTTAELADVVEHLSGEDTGVAVARGGSVESRIKQSQGVLDELLRYLDSKFIEYRGLQAGGAFRNAIAKATIGARDLAAKMTKGEQNLSKREFSRAVNRALEDDTHENPFVMAVAKEWREKGYDHFTKQAQHEGLLDQDLERTISKKYVMRAWKTQRIQAESGRLRGIFMDWLKGKRDTELGADPNELPKWKARRDELRGIVEKFQNDKTGLLAALSGAHDAAKKTASRFLQDMRRIRRRMNESQAQGSTLGTELAMADARRKSGKLTSDDPLRQLIWDAKFMKEPPRLVTEVRAQGGVNDADGVLKSLGYEEMQFNKDGTPKKGKGWERQIIAPNDTAPDLAEFADEAIAQGYVQPLPGHQYEQLFIDALSDDVSGRRKVYAEHGPEADLIDRWHEVEALRESAKKDGIHFDEDKSIEQFAYELGAIDKGTGPRKRASGAWEQSVRDRIVKLSDESGALRKEHAELKTKHDDADAEASRSLTEYEKNISQFNEARREKASIEAKIGQRESLLGMKDEDFGNTADEIIEGLISLDGRPRITGLPMTRSAFKDIKLDIPNAKVRDFLEDDAEMLLRMFVRSVTPDIELKRKFGDVDLAGRKADIIEDYRKLREGLPQTLSEAKREKALNRLAVRQRLDLDNLSKMVDRLRGNFGRPQNPDGFLNRANIAARNWNLARLSGGFLPASITDVGSIAMTHGMMNMLGRHGLGKLIQSTKAFNLIGKEVRLSGTGNDIILDTRNHAIADIIDDYGRHSAFERGMQVLADKSGLVNAMSIWNHYMKKITGIITVGRLLEAMPTMAKNPKGMNPKEHARMLWLGIDQSLADEINIEFQTHKETIDGVDVPNVDAWENKEAAAAFRSAVNKEVDTTIVTPGQEKPFWMSTQEGKFFAQFRSFTVSSLMRVSARGLQSRERLNTAQGMVLMTALGMLSYRIRVPADRRSEDPAVWVKEGIERSGLISYLNDANILLEKGTGFGVGPALGLPRSRRNPGASFMGELLGPTYRTVADDLVPMLNNLGQGKVTKADEKRVGRLIPYYNMFYLRPIWDQFDEDASPN